jgi:hypothetical protein
MTRDPRVEHAKEASRRAARNGALTPEDAILLSLLAESAVERAQAARLVASAALLDRDYLEYWVDALGLQERWRPLR